MFGLQHFESCDSDESGTHHQYHIIKQETTLAHFQYTNSTLLVYYQYTISKLITHLVCYIEDYDNTISSSIITRRYCPESLLTSCIPLLKFKLLN